MEAAAAGFKRAVKERDPLGMVKYSRHLREGHGVGNVEIFEMTEQAVSEDGAGVPTRLPNPLAMREAQILDCCAVGMSNVAVGKHLHLSANTVKTYLDRVYGKLGVRDRTAAVAMALKNGWITGEASLQDGQRTG